MHQNPRVIFAPKIKTAPQFLLGIYTLLRPARGDTAPELRARNLVYGLRGRLYIYIYIIYPFHLTCRPRFTNTHSHTYTRIHTYTHVSHSALHCRPSHLTYTKLTVDRILTQFRCHPKSMIR